MFPSHQLIVNLHNPHIITPIHTQDLIRNLLMSCSSCYYGCCNVTGYCAVSYSNCYSYTTTVTSSVILSTGAIIGIVVGVVAFVAIIAGLSYWRRRKIQERALMAQRTNTTTIIQPMAVPMQQMGNQQFMQPSPMGPPMGQMFNPMTQQPPMNQPFMY